MKEIEKEPDEKADGIYKLVWVNEKKKLSDGKTTEQKIKRYNAVKIFKSLCEDGKKCGKYKQVLAKEPGLAVAPLYLLTSEKAPGEADGGKMVEQDVKKYELLDMEGKLSLYRKVCTGEKGKESCQMEPLIDNVDKVDDVTGEENGDYIVYHALVSVKKKKAPNGTMITERNNDYKEAFKDTKGPFFTKSCAAGACHHEPVKEEKGLNFYKMVVQKKKSKKTGELEETKHFEV
jgi:hypothetical protein